jgi:uncharacterized OB-fold protein
MAKSQEEAIPAGVDDVHGTGEPLKPVMPYLAFAADGHPYLLGSKCGRCGQIFLGARENCAKCAARGQMAEIELGTTGSLYNYTIVYRSFPGVSVPFVSAIVDLDGGGTVKGNLLDVEPSPEKIRFGMKVKMVFRGAEIANSAGAGFVSHFFVPAGQENVQ